MMKLFILVLASALVVQASANDLQNHKIFKTGEFEVLEVLEVLEREPNSGSADCKTVSLRIAAPLNSNENIIRCFKSGSVALSRLAAPEAWIVDTEKAILVARGRIVLRVVGNEAIRSVELRSDFYNVGLLSIPLISTEFIIPELELNGQRVCVLEWTLAYIPLESLKDHYRERGAASPNTADTRRMVAKSQPWCEASVP